MEKLRSKKLNHEEVLYDPVHSYIHIKDKVVLDITNSKEFQRLHRIKQLGPAFYVSQGATHTRFGHNLGAYELARRICNIFEEKYTSKEPGDELWDPNERLLAECAALLHDIGHDPYPHTFEYLFDTNHEKMGRRITADRNTKANQALRQVSPSFPELVVSVVAKTYSNPQVIKLISSQTDADRMSYLLRNAYFAEVTYSNFDLAGILEVIRPYCNGICFTDKGVHAVEDYTINRYQMYQQVYFHHVDRSIEVILHHLLRRTQIIYGTDRFQVTPQLEAFLKENWTLEDYLNLDGGVMETNFLLQTNSDDQILSDPSSRYLYRHPLESVKINGDTKSLLPKLKNLIKQAGFDSNYYTATNSTLDGPYDAHKPVGKNAHSPIEIMQADGSLVKLSELSPLVKSSDGALQGDECFFFPKVMIKETDEPQISDPIYQEFQKYIRSDTSRCLRRPDEKK